MVVVSGADGDARGDVALPAGVAVGVESVVETEAGSGVGVGVAVSVGVGVGLGVGAGVGLSLGVGVGVAVGVGVGTGLTDWPQLSVRKLTRRRENARKQLLIFRFIAKEGDVNPNATFL